MTDLNLEDVSVLSDRDAELSAIATAHARPDEFAEMALEPDHFEDPKLRQLCEIAQELYRSGSKQRLLAAAPSKAPRFREAIESVRRARMGVPRDIARRLDEKRTIRRVWGAAEALKAAVGTVQSGA